jgi:6-phosphogluconate dehydrogenase
MSAALSGLTAGAAGGFPANLLQAMRDYSARTATSAPKSQRGELFHTEWQTYVR